MYCILHLKVHQTISLLSDELLVLSLPVWYLTPIFCLKGKPIKIRCSQCVRVCPKHMAKYIYVRGYVLTMSSLVMTSSNQPHVSDQSSVQHRTPTGSSLITTTFNPVTHRSTSLINAALLWKLVCTYVFVCRGVWLNPHNRAVCEFVCDLLCPAWKGVNKLTSCLLTFLNLRLLCMFTRQKQINLKVLVSILACSSAVKETLLNL